MKTKSLVFSLLIFLSGLAIAALALSPSPQEPGAARTPEVSQRPHEFQNDESSVQGFTALFQLVHVEENGETSLQHLSLRYQRSDGSWREDFFVPTNGRLVLQNTTFGSPKRGGVFRRGKDNQNHFVGGSSGLLARRWTEEKLRNNPQFVGEDEVLGLKTFVLRNQRTDMTYHIAPQLGIIPIKIEEHDSTREPISLVIGDPPKECCTPSEGAVDTRAYESLIGDSDSRTARILSKQLDKFLKKEAAKNEGSESPPRN